MVNNLEAYVIDDPYLLSESDWNAIEEQLIECGVIIRTSAPVDDKRREFLNQMALYWLKLEDELQTMHNRIMAMSDSVTKIEMHIMPEKSHYLTRKEYLEAKANAFVYKDKYTRK